jgi:hypothetical protein
VRIVSTNSECAPFERVDEAAAGPERRPAPRLDRAAHLQGELVEPDLPLRRLEALLAREAPQVAVGADVVEAVVVHAHVGEVRRHPRQRPIAADVEELFGAGRVVLQQRRAELEPLGPLGPAARAIAPVDGEDRRAVVRLPRIFDRKNLARRDVEEALDAG